MRPYSSLYSLRLCALLIILPCGAWQAVGVNMPKTCPCVSGKLSGVGESSMQMINKLRNCEIGEDRRFGECSSRPPVRLRSGVLTG